MEKRSFNWKKFWDGMNRYVDEERKITDLYLEASKRSLINSEKHLKLLNLAAKEMKETTIYQREVKEKMKGI